MNRLIRSKQGLVWAVLGVLAVLPGCRKQAPPPPPPASSVPEAPLAPWNWHKFGGLLVVVGEVDGPMDLVLKGRYLNESMHAEFGPVRWELYAPPPNEIAELRTRAGKLLARWEFDAPVPKPVESPKPVQKAKSARVTQKATERSEPPPVIAQPAALVKPVPQVKPVIPIKPELPLKPVVPDPLPKTPQKSKVARIPWPETHLPLFHGQMTQRVPAPRPSPRPAQVAQAMPGTPTSVPAVPLPTAAPLAQVKPVIPIKPELPVKPSVPAPLLKTPQKSQVARLPWPETHFPLFHGQATQPVLTPRPGVRPAQVVQALPEAHSSVPPVPLPPAAALAQVPLAPPPKPEPLPQPSFPPSPIKEWPGAGEALNLIRGPRGSHWVCMTFDGGSTSEVALEVLDALKERSIRTTFFLTGSFIQNHPELVRRMDREGHEIGNHTMDHPHFAPGGRRDLRWTKDRFQQQLLLADSLLLKLLGRPMDPYWRAPYGENTAELRKWAEELGYRHIYWSEGADTLDWATRKERKLYRTGNAILDRLYSRMEKDDGDGLIVLMHLGSGRPEADRPARVLGPFLDKALAEGWNFVNISAYLQESGKPRWNSSNRLARLGQTAPRQ